MSSPYRNDQAARQQLAASLSKLLADTYTLYLKTQGFHWNVTGPRFYDLHKLFEAEGTSVCQWIRTSRLERCRRDLLDPLHVGRLAVQMDGHHDARTRRDAFAH